MIGYGVKIDEAESDGGKNQVFVGRNQGVVEGIRFPWKESGFVGKNQVLSVVL